MYNEAKQNENKHSKCHTILQKKTVIFGQIKQIYN